MSDDQSAPTSESSKPGNIPGGKFAARLTPKSVEYLRLISESEDISLNDALNLIIQRQSQYPKDMA